MSRALLSLSAALFLSVNPFTVHAVEDKPKTDLETSIPEGKEFALPQSEVILSDMPNEQGFLVPLVKPSKAGAKVKMPAQAYGLNVGSKPVKDGLEIVTLPEDSALLSARTTSQKGDMSKAMAEEGDIITHVDGQPVTNVEELVFALSTAKDKKEVQLVVKDKNSGNLIVLYVRGRANQRAQGDSN